LTLLLDAGAFLALERNDRAMWRRLKAAHRDGHPPVTHGGIVAQVWRGGARQALVARALGAVRVEALDDMLGRQAGVLLARTSTSDAIDAALAALARHGDRILTSDPDDLALLVGATDQRVDVVPV
jgi:hypothetical protein